MEEAEVEEWLNCDKEEVGYQFLTDDEIAEEVLTTDDEAIDSEYDGSQHGENTPAESVDQYQEAKEAVQLLDKFIYWYIKQEEAECITVLNLRRLREMAKKKSEKTKKQSKVTNFFEKKK